MITLCINQTNTDTFFNLAAEEYFLKNFQEDFFILWRSKPSVVVGKHQNALAEINHRFVRENKIPVARRLSGGGTVFHDLGNVNFTFIRNVEKISEVNFKVFTVPVVEALKKLGVDVYSTGRNDLVIDGKKISGNAEHVHRNRVLHHGTLLFESKLDSLKGALNVDLSRFEDKSVQSNRSEVTNIAACLQTRISVGEFKDFLFSEVSPNFGNFRVYELNESDIAAIEKLAVEKYRTWEWIFGYSPKYRFSNTFETSKGAVLISFQVEKGIITELSISGQISELVARQTEESLVGCKHNIDDVKNCLFDLIKEFELIDELIGGMF